MGLDPQRFGAYGLVATEILGEIQKTLADEPKEGVAPFIKVAQAWKTAQETKQSSAVA